MRNAHRAKIQRKTVWNVHFQAPSCRIVSAQRSANIETHHFNANVLFKNFEPLN